MTTHIFDNIFLQILDSPLFQAALHGTQIIKLLYRQMYDLPCWWWDIFFYVQVTEWHILLLNCIVNIVHCISNVLEHASEGHKQVAVLVAFQEAGRKCTYFVWLFIGYFKTVLGSRGKKGRGQRVRAIKTVHSLCISAASGEEVHKARIDIRLCGEREKNSPISKEI